MPKLETLDFESIQDNQSIVNHLRSLMEGFEKGQIHLNTKEGQMTLRPNNLLQFTLKVSKKGDKNKLSLKISWKDMGEIHAESEKIFIGSN